MFAGSAKGTPTVKVALADEDHSELSARIAAGLASEKALRVQLTSGDAPGGAPLTRQGAEALVRNGDVPVAVVIPRGLGEWT